MSTKHDGPRNERTALDAYIKLRRAVNAVSKREAVAIRSFGLTESQFGVLEALRHLGPLCQQDLAAKILKSAGNVTTVIDNLERRELVERRRNGEDRRVVTVALTDPGSALIGEAYPQVAAVLVECFSHLTARELEQLSALCRKLGTRQPSTKPNDHPDG